MTSNCFEVVCELKVVDWRKENDNILLFQDHKELEEPTDVKEAQGGESYVGFELETRHKEGDGTSAQPSK